MSLVDRDILMLMWASLDDQIWLGRHYLAAELARNNRVHWVERNRTLLGNLRQSLKRAPSIPPKTTVQWSETIRQFQPSPKYPLDRRLPISSRLSQKRLAAEVAAYLKHSGVSSPLLFTSMHNAAPTVRRLAPDGYCAYFVYDDIWGYEWSGQRELVVKEEIATANAVNDIFVCSQGLMEKFQRLGLSPVYFPHAVDTDVFSVEAAQRLGVPDEMEEIRKNGLPIISFIGKLRKTQTDEKILAEILRAGAGKYNFVFIGPVIDIDVHALAPGNPNLHVLGVKDFNKLSAYIYSSDAIMVPYHVNDYTAQINSIKTLQLLALGKPVLTTPFNRETEEMRDVLRLFDSVESFDAEMQNVLSGEPDEVIEKRIRKADENSWSSRIKIIETAYNAWEQGRGA